MAYSSDVEEVRTILLEACHQLEWVNTKIKSQMRLSEFGENTLVFEVLVWTDNPWKSEEESAALNDAIWWALQDASITIAFPQLDVHFDPAPSVADPVSRSFPDHSE